MKNYNERDCVAALNKKQCCRISGNLIEVSKDNYDVGLKSWAKINFLCKRCGYRYIITTFAGNTVSKKNKKKFNEDYEENKPTNKKGKLNLHEIVKNIMNS